MTNEQLTAPAVQSGQRAGSVRIERRFRASPARVFRAWTTAEELNQWTDPEPTPAKTEVDLRVGGRYSITMARPDGAVIRASGTYREIDPPRRLVYTWVWETTPGFPESVVTVEFKSRPDGGTDLVLVHEGLPDKGSRERHTHGWTGCMVKLAAVVDSSEH